MIQRIKKLLKNHGEILFALWFIVMVIIAATVVFAVGMIDFRYR